MVGVTQEGVNPWNQKETQLLDDSLEGKRSGLNCVLTKGFLGFFWVKKNQEMYSWDDEIAKVDVDFFWGNRWKCKSRKPGNQRECPMG